MLSLLTIYQGVHITYFNTVEGVKHDNENERGQMSPGQGEKGENTPFTKQCR